MRLLLCVLVCVSVSQALKIAAFNIKRLSENTLNKYPGRKEELAKIMSRYDLLSVEEVMDEHGLDDVVSIMNSHGGGPYTLIRSPKTGRTSYKEFYAFVYRTDLVEVRDSYQYNDVHDWFEREPFAALFHVPSAELSDFVIAACHMKPDKADPEIGRIINVYQDFKTHFKTERLLNQISSIGNLKGVTSVGRERNVMFDGDFNADCSYMSKTRLENNPLYRDHSFEWLLSSSVDTTVSHHTNCAYDRFVVAGQAFKTAIVPGSAGVYNFETADHLTFDTAWHTSDHYPIEVQLKSV